ncbi:MAG: hypothetical protein ABIR54_16875 [Burkholderiaceae bacterium]
MTSPSDSPAFQPERSGSAWIARFPTSALVSDCALPFRARLTGFLAALRAAGASVNVAATLRPAQRAYLMHWCWSIVKAKADPRTIPLLDGVAIAWAHVDDQGDFDADASMGAALAMVNAYGMQNLSVAPALASKHISGTAVDMAIGWAGDLTIANQDGTPVTITSLPRTGMNRDLKTVGATYGVIKFVGGATDIPHWSDDGH